MEKRIVLQKSTKALQRTASLARISAIVSLVNLGISILKLTLDFGHAPEVATQGVIPILISSVLTALLAASLFKFSSHIRNGLVSNDEVAIHSGFFHLKNYFLIIGVLFIFMIAMIVLGLIIVLLKQIIS